MNQTPLAITISRQLGSGGAYIGQQLAKKLNIYYADHEIIRKTSKMLSVSEADVMSNEEKTQSLWKYFVQLNTFASEAYIPLQPEPIDSDLYDAESEVIECIAKAHSAVIIGRCGFHVLRNYPNRVSIYLHGEESFRAKRIQKMHNITEQAARQMLAKSDKERAHYIETFTGHKWSDARLYDLCIDTSKVGLDNSVDLILNYLEMR